ncbi:DUF4189 domain-containing protein [Reyranella aquatilis]|jgi:hypothetical protein|uniref:DUF4189 domain-containing protein n=1 Tax=Reyranella aquatilis TaxID=2035356 RepID=A0ABS8KXZ6_9HYPH|nr:DUF4189 domain-containing protein [Reyranella aquatilis]MCC8430935.1 DUF4189 domain-containing protein [Reyranella aquatilis]
MFRFLALVALFSWLIAGAATAHAQNQAPQYWVTYAYDSSTGAWGLGWGRTDRQTTINEALSRCAKPGCKVGNVTLARCIAIAEGTQRGPGFGYGNDANSAKANALRFCQQGPAGSTCELTAWRCGGS